MADLRPQVVWSSNALADLTVIWTHYSKIAGRLTADKTARDVFAACRTLQERPFAGRTRNEIRMGLRSIAAGPLVVFYRVGRDESAEIVRVLDRRRDVDDVFAGEGDRR
ncbi:MAG TPA: type II toxin-antitoxin system RelE/ParE family toxin [Xanthobacteraceae bacterium]